MVFVSDGQKRVRWVCARPRAAFDCGKKLAANVSRVCAVLAAN